MKKGSLQKITVEIAIMKRKHGKSIFQYYNPNTADLISKLISPPIIVTIAIIVFSFWSPIGLGSLSISLSILLGFFFLALLPYLPVIYFSKKMVVDIYVSKRGARTPFFLISMLSYFLATIIFLGTSSKIMFLLALGHVCVTLILVIINLFWKVSTHCAGVAGPITALIYVFGIEYMPLFLFLVPLSWARMKLKTHTFVQTLVGALIAVVVGITEYSALYP